MARMRCFPGGRGKNVFAWRLCDLIKSFFSWSGGGKRMLRKLVEPVTMECHLRRKMSVQEGPGDSQGKGTRTRP